MLHVQRRWKYSAAPAMHHYIVYRTKRKKRIIWLNVASRHAEGGGGNTLGLQCGYSQRLVGINAHGSMTTELPVDSLSPNEFSARWSARSNRSSPSQLLDISRSRIEQALMGDPQRNRMCVGRCAGVGLRRELRLVTETIIARFGNTSSANTDWLDTLSMRMEKRPS